MLRQQDEVMKVVHDEPGLVIGPDRRLDGLCLRFFGCRVVGDTLIRPKKLGLLTEVALALTHSLSPREPAEI